MRVARAFASQTTRSRALCGGDGRGRGAAASFVAGARVRDVTYKSSHAPPTRIVLRRGGVVLGASEAGGGYAGERWPCCCAGTGNCRCGARGCVPTVSTS